MITVAEHSRGVWHDEIVPALTDYVRIPALSPAFDPDWAEHGHIAHAVRQLREWAESRAIDGMTVEVHERAGLTPVILIEVPPTAGASATDTVLLYGHLDKQPEMVGWRDGLGPWSPVIEGDKLFGRGAADDGYAMFAALTAIEAVRSVAGGHTRCVVLIEASEESGSPHLAPHVEALASRIGTPSLIVCLDSGAADYERLWITTSLRGVVNGVLRVEITSEGLHSGAVGGLVPSTFRIARQLLDRIEDVATGQVLVDEAMMEIPPDRLRQAEAAAAIVGDIRAKLPLLDGVDLAERPAVELLLDRTWRPSLSVIGADGIPAVLDGGNVLRPMTALSLSVRTPPTADVEAVAEGLRSRLETNPPYGAKVSYEAAESGPGWNAPAVAPWLERAAEVASSEHFGRPAAYMGEGGSIPFMGMLGERFPEAQFLIIGVLGPGSNAHGPNEFLHIPTGIRLTSTVADVLMAHANR